jgi:hypothetical protein
MSTSGQVREDAHALLYAIRNAPVSGPDPGPLIEKLKNTNPADPSAIMGAISPYIYNAPTDVTAAPFRRFVDDMEEAIRKDQSAATSVPDAK